MKNSHEITNKIIHRITNTYTSDFELLDTEKSDEYYQKENKLLKAISYNKYGVAVSETLLYYESENTIVYQDKSYDGDNETVSYCEETWNEDKTVITTTLLDENKIVESVDISMYSDGQLLEQTLIADGNEIAIKYYHDINGKIAVMKEYVNGVLKFSTKYDIEGKGRRIVRYSADNNKILEKKYEETDQLGRLVLMRDYNEMNQVIGEAEFTYDKNGEIIQISYSSSLNTSYIKKLYNYGNEKEKTFIENIFNYVYGKMWEPHIEL